MISTLEVRELRWIFRGERLKSGLAKIGRNERCPCGSGKKYKRCHGTAGISKPQTAPPPPPTFGPEKRSDGKGTHVPIAPMGMPGLVQHVITVNEFADPNDPRNQSGPSGQPGFYKVVFVFSRPGYPLLSEKDFMFAAELKGDSHLAILGPAYSTPANERSTQVRIYGDTPEGQFTFDGYPNEQGFLGKIVLESVHAKSFDDAELKAYRALAPSLSIWSLYRDIPLHIWQTDSVELATGNARTSFVNPVVAAAWAVPARGTMSEEFRRYASLYREALNSNTPAYQFLCFFKIIEGVQTRRARINADGRSKGQGPKRYDERIPDNRADCEVWLKAIFYGRPPWDPMSIDEIFRPEILGKKLSRVIESELRPLRVRVAHAILNSGEPTLIADEGLDIQKITKWLPLAKCIVRRMLKNEFPEFLPFVNEDGTVKE